MGGVTNSFYKPDLYCGYIGYKDNVYIQDKETKIRIRYVSKNKGRKGWRNSDDFISSRALIEMAKKLTGAKYTGYYIASHRNHIINTVYPYEFNFIDNNVMRQQKKSLTNNLRSDGYITSNMFGFDEYFFVLSSDMKVEESKIEVAADAKKGAISRAFIYSLNKRGIQRQFLNRFVQNLAA
jgi:hypothetical protein